MASTQDCRNASIRKPHALVIPMPFQGHIQPLMEFSKKLISAGFMVTFANVEFIHQKVTQSLHNEDIYGGDLRMVSLEEGFGAEQLENSATIVAASFSPAMKASVVRLLTRLGETEHPITLLVSEFRLYFLHIIAEKHGIPSVCFWTQSAANFSCNLYVAQLGFHFPPDDSTLITGVPGVPPFKCSEITNFALDKMPPPFPCEEYVWPPFKHLLKPTWIVINTFKELEGTTLETVQDFLGFQPFALGPLVNAPSFSVPKGIKEIDMDEILQWLHGLPPTSVLYVAFGTLIVLSEEQLEELMLGFEASEQHILWVFRPDLCKNSEKYTIDSLSRRLKKQGSMVVSWAPQWDVLRHPSVGGFLTHCGWNSTLEGITAGVPMLAWPGFIDQFLTRRCIEHQWSIGMGFEGDEGRDGLASQGFTSHGTGKGSGLVSRAEVEKKVRELMQGERGKEMREKAGILGERARRAFDGGGSSQGNFSLFLEGYKSFWKGG